MARPDGKDQFGNYLPGELVGYFEQVAQGKIVDEGDGGEEPEPPGELLGNIEGVGDPTTADSATLTGSGSLTPSNVEGAGDPT